MLIEFTVGNYLSFKEPVTLSMVASSDKTTLPQNVIEPKGVFKQRLLKSAVIYGANASGKSNLIKAMEFMTWFVRYSSRGSIEDPIRFEQFAFNSEKEAIPSLFEVDFVYGGIRYLYGFKINNIEVIDEWLYYYPHGRQVRLFERQGATFVFNEKIKKEGDSLVPKTRKNSLFLSVASQFNLKEANIVTIWFRSFISHRPDIEFNRFQPSITRNLILRNEETRKHILSMLKGADFGISDIEIVENEEEVILGGTPKSIEDNTGVRVRTKAIIHEASFTRSFENNDGENVSVSLPYETESDGTKSFFNSIGYIISMVEGNYVLKSDELDMRLHPLLAERIINYFHINSAGSNAQLIFTTHNTQLMRPELFRRDQIWFTEKEHFSRATRLFSLSDYKGARKEENFQKRYLDGKYGAIPILEAFDKYEPKKESN